MTAPSFAIEIAPGDVRSWFTHRGTLEEERRLGEYPRWRVELVLQTTDEALALEAALANAIVRVTLPSGETIDRAVIDCDRWPIRRYPIIVPVEITPL